MVGRKYWIGFCFLMLAFYTYAQQSPGAERTQKLQQLNVALDGTYQIQVLNSRELPMFPLNLLTKIDSLRSENDTIYIPVKPRERIMVLPRKVIDSPGFKKPEHVVHITTD